MRALTAVAVLAGCDPCGNFFLLPERPLCGDAADADVPRLADGARADTIMAISLTSGAAADRFTVGATVPITAHFTLDDGSVRDALASDVRWRSDRATVATVDAAGIVTAVGEGVVVIRADVGSRNALLVLRVRAAGWEPATIVRLRVDPAVASIHVGQAQWFWATADYSDGSSAQITRVVTWASSAPGVATIASDGTARSVLAGEATVSATYQGVVASPAALTVLP